MIAKKSTYMFANKDYTKNYLSCIKID